MFKAFRLQSPLARAFEHGDVACIVCDVADICGGHMIDCARQASQVARSDGEEQLEVFAAVQRQHERIERTTRAYVCQMRIEGNARDFERSADVALFAQM